jgi:hypothetical protein
MNKLFSNNIPGMKHYTTIVLILLFVISGCNKKPKVDHYTISDEIKQWYLFQKGSYWIYINDVTQKTDSTYINEIPEFAETWAHPENGPIVDNYTIYFKDSFLLESSVSPFNIGLLSYHGSAGLAFVPSVGEGKMFFIDSGIYEYIHHYDSIFLNNQTFYDIRHTRSSGPTGMDTLKFDYYFSKFIGLIKFGYSRGEKDTTWSLLRYHVVQ